MHNVLTEYLGTYFEEIGFIDFYRYIFPKGSLQSKGEYKEGVYNAILVEVTTEKNNGKNKILRHTVTDDLDKLDDVCSRENFTLMSPIDYVGKSRNSNNARNLYALAIDLDGIRISADNEPVGLRDLFHQINNIERIPNPTFIVSSGTGVHLYYVFDEAIPLFKNVVGQLQKFKKELTRIIWQGYITTLEDNVQYESLFQGFRVVGTITKKGERARAFITGERVSMEYMNQFVSEEFQVTNLSYKSKLTLKDAAQKYPQWYKKRVIEKQPRGTWTCKRDLYDWWINKMLEGAKVGHRYYCLMMLAVYARKSGISQEELENDAFKLMGVLDELTNDQNNPFTEKDVLDALQAYEDRYITYPINSISYLTDIHIEKNKRNGRKQEVHLMGARAIQEINDRVNGTNWREGNGRKTAEEKVREWQLNNPGKRKADCVRETGLSKPTVYKWW